MVSSRRQRACRSDHALHTPLAKNSRVHIPHIIYSLTYYTHTGMHTHAHLSCHSAAAKKQSRRPLSPRRPPFLLSLSNCMLSSRARAWTDCKVVSATLDWLVYPYLAHCDPFWPMSVRISCIKIDSEPTYLAGAGRLGGDGTSYLGRVKQPSDSHCRLPTPSAQFPATATVLEPLRQTTGADRVRFTWRAVAIVPSRKPTSVSVLAHLGKWEGNTSSDLPRISSNPSIPWGRKKKGRGC